MEDLTESEREFLSDVFFGKPLRLADRKQDKIRQRMRKLGYAEVLSNPRRWSVTDKGIIEGLGFGAEA